VLIAADHPVDIADEAPLAPTLSLSDALLARLALLQGQGLLDVGRSREALRRLDAALRLYGGGKSSAKTADPKMEAEARYERAVALFELCQFKTARAAFEEWLAQHPKDEALAWAHHHLGLTLEMMGEAAAAEREFALARQLEPERFFALMPIAKEEFRALVDAETQTLPKESAADLKLVRLETADLPDLDDLTVEEPPLSPTILGLYRGLPVGQEPSEPRAIVLYRKNLLRAVHSREELVTEIHTTLLHELGHLRGADDNELRERGLE